MRLSDLDGMSVDELMELRQELERRLPKTAIAGGKRARAGGKQGESINGYHVWGDGWLQRDPRRRTNKDGSERVYRYWVYHWIEDGKHKTLYIGGDAKLEEWKANNPTG